MMTLSFLLALALAATQANAQNPTAYIPLSPSHSPSISAPACIPPPGATCTPSNNTSTTPHFLPTWPASLRPPASAATQIPSLLSSLQSSWSQQPSYTALASALYEAAPTSAQFSLAVYGQFSGWNWENIVQQPWYTSLPQKYLDMVDAEKKVLQKGFDDASGNREVVSGGARVGGNCVDGVVLAWCFVLVGWLGGVVVL